LSQLKEYHPSESLKLNYLGISQSLKLRISMEKILLISLKLNFTPNTFCCYGLMEQLLHLISRSNEKTVRCQKFTRRFSFLRADLKAVVEGNTHGVRIRVVQVSIFGAYYLGEVCRGLLNRSRRMPR